MIEITTLTNGLRIITDHVPTVDSIALGAWFDVGARDESRAENGIAHMVEHMMFKGTPSRDARKIAEEIENVGGNTNAYTGRETTAYHMHLLKNDSGLGIDILGDILQNSTFDAEELEKERQVILQEIGMVNDTPDDLIFNHYQETAFPNQSVGAPILGHPEIVSSIEQKSLHNYTSTRYAPGRMVISAAGNLNHKDIVAKVETAFQNLPVTQDMPRSQAKYRGGAKIEEKELEQSHIVLGFQGIAKTDPRYYCAGLFSTILGGGMSSRLFQEIREKRGLVYAVYSFHLGLSDNGLFGVYAGTGPESLTELVPVMCEEIIKAADSVTEEELHRAKAQAKADLVMDRESMMTRADQQAKRLILFGDKFDPQKMVEKLEKITCADIRDVAIEMVSTPPTLCALGPLKSLENYDSIKNRLAA